MSNSTKNPFYVQEWMIEKYPEEVKQIANEMFNGEIVVIPKRYKSCDT